MRRNHKVNRGLLLQSVTADQGWRKRKNAKLSTEVSLVIEIHSCFSFFSQVTRTGLLVFVLLMRLSTPALASHAGRVSGFIQYSRKSRRRLRWNLRKVFGGSRKERGIPSQRSSA